MSRSELLWRVEEACRNAAPSPREVTLRGWLLRLGGGSVRRTNSVNPLHGPRAPLAEVIDEIEAIYGRLGQDALFRVPGIADEHDGMLVARGYMREGATSTWHAPTLGASEGGASLAPSPDARWLAARARLAGLDASDMAGFKAMTDAIALPAAFAWIDVEGDVGAQAFGVISDGFLILEAVATDPALRRRGLGREVVASLMAWARQQGARAACLQVAAGNDAARALYSRLGFTEDLYPYHYLRLPRPSDA